MVVGECHGTKLDGNSAERYVASVILSREDPRFLGIVYPSSFVYYCVVCQFKKRGLVAQTYDSERLSLLTRACSLLSKRVWFFQEGQYRFECPTA